MDSNLPRLQLELYKEIKKVTDYIWVCRESYFSLFFFLLFLQQDSSQNVLTYMKMNPLTEWCLSESEGSFVEVR